MSKKESTDTEKTENQNYNHGIHNLDKQNHLSYKKQNEVEEINEKVKSHQSKGLIIGGILYGLTGILALTFALIFNRTFLNNAPKGAINWFPGNFILELMLIWIAPGVLFFVILLLQPFLARVYLFLHKILKLNQFNYSLVDLEENFITFKETLSRMVIPILFCFVLGYWYGHIFNVLDNEIPIQILQYIYYSFLLSPIVLVLIIPLWLLDDSGIISMNKRAIDERKVPQIEGPSRFFMNLYTGSAITLAIVTLIDYFIVMINEFVSGLFGAFLFTIVIFLMQWFSIIYLYEAFMLKRKNILLSKIPDKILDKEPKIIVNLHVWEKRKQQL